MEEFRETLDFCNLHDASYYGKDFTWRRGRSVDNLIQERLDRFVVSANWWDSWPKTGVHHLFSSVSDHCPIMLRTQPVVKIRRKVSGRRRRFFEAGWCKEHDCEDVVKGLWVEGTNKHLKEKLELTREGLSMHYKNTFSGFRRKIEELLEEMRKCGMHNKSEADLNHERRVRDDLNKVLEEEESFWMQRSRVNWLKEGDRNTAFFHAQASKRKKYNEIQRLKGDDGVWYEGLDDLHKIATDYFMKLFNSNEPKDYDDILEKVQPRVTAEMNELLLAEFTAEEIYCALKQMHPTKVPGPDGMPVFFFQKYWSLVSCDIVRFCLDFFHGKISLHDINHTHIVLIPKVPKPTNMSQFRPISLCNVLYKIVSKVLVNRLKHILPSCISESQSAFVPGRLISDNILVAYELLHVLKNTRKGKQGHFALKLDMSKAYDRVEWDFLESIMLRLGFNGRWVNMVMACIRSVSFSVIVNGAISESFVPKRGLRQGDPLSPYLFLMCTEGLSALLSNSQKEKLISGVHANRSGPNVNHLFFADDSLLFGKANETECKQVMSMIRKYEEGSGQKINFDKSSIFFSSNTTEAQKTTLLSLFQVEEKKCIEKYLGLPVMVGRNKQRAFRDIKDRMAKRLHNWNSKMLSQGGREVMIKSVLQSIPTYAMSVFLLPKKLCDELNGLIRKFWWKQQTDKRPIYWIQWQKECRPKDVGGMGFREMGKFNIAMLAKQGWRLLHAQDTLLYKVMKAKYFPNSSFLEAKQGRNSSFTWRSIWQTRKLLETGSCWRVGDRCQIRILQDKWVPTIDNLCPLSARGSLDDDSIVASLIENGEWNGELIKSLFSELEGNAIRQISLSRTKLQDKIIWYMDKKGEYSVKGGYRVLCSLAGEPDERSVSEMEEDKKVLRATWQVLVPPKIKVFGWRLFHEILPVLDALKARGLVDDSVCMRCKMHNESVVHAIKECPMAKEVWNIVTDSFVSVKKASLGIDFRRDEDWQQDPDWFQLAMVTAWAIWGARNKAMYEKELIHPRQTACMAMSLLEEYVKSQERMQVVAPALKEKWRPPLHDFIKINFDGAWDKTRKVGGIGIVARDGEGNVLGALASRMDFAGDPTAVEGRAALKAVEWSHQMGFSAIQVEGDSLEVINKLNSTIADLSIIGHFIEAARLQLHSFSRYKVTHIRRNGNRVAHELAKFGQNLDGDQIWMEEPPVWVLPHVISDCNGSFI